MEGVQEFVREFSNEGNWQDEEAMGWRDDGMGKWRNEEEEGKGRGHDELNTLNITKNRPLHSKK